MSEGENVSLRLWRVKPIRLGQVCLPDVQPCSFIEAARMGGVLEVQLGSRKRGAWKKKRKPACRWGLCEQRSDRCAAAQTTALSPTQDSFNEAQTLCHVGAREAVLVVAEDASEDSDSGVRFGRSAIMGFEPSVGRHAGCCLQVQWANVLSGTQEGCTYR